MFSALKKELLSFSSSEKIFVFCAMLCGFCITADYGIIRPVSNAVLLSAFGSKIFPWVWLAIIPLNFLVVTLYNRFLPKWGCWKMFVVIVSSVIGGNVLCALFMKQVVALPFLFYVWKEVYVLLMFQQLWSVIHATMKVERAKYLYGLIFAVGGLGGVLGSFISGFFAVKSGSENLLFLTFPFYLLLIVAYFYMVKHSGELPQSDATQQGSVIESMKLISSSRFLMFILLIVVFMQVSATLVYYQFNTSLEAAIGDKDLRTEYCGRVLGIVNIATIVLQLIGSFLLVHFLGLRRSHIFVPSVLGLNAIGSLLFPSFTVISSSFITIKSFDFSLFGIIKEMLYVPLKLDEKFRAKAIIDVFAFRSSKGIASGLILFMELFGVLGVLPWVIVAIYFVWGITARVMLKTVAEEKTAKPLT